jgi:hypothetical protein
MRESDKVDPGRRSSRSIIGIDAELRESQSNILGEAPLSRYRTLIEQPRRCKCVDAGTDAALGVRT